MKKILPKLSHLAILSLVLITPSSFAQLVNPISAATSISVSGVTPVAKAAATTAPTWVKVSPTAGGLSTGLNQAWMSPDVSSAWSSGYSGKGSTITSIDNFSTATFNLSTGNVGTGTFSLSHGAWTAGMSYMIAPNASLASQDYTTASGTLIPLAKTGLNVINASYAMYAAKTYTVANMNWSKEEQSLISYATNGNAIVAKAAGNDAVAIGAANAAGQIDFLNTALSTGKTQIFVGALTGNGTTTAKASMQTYSNTAGTNTLVQAHFLSVGVNSTQLGGLAGTSFAAPIVSGYAAILGSKFTTSTPTSITNQLLNTARTDTLNNYSAAVYGKGEASLSRALAPATIK